MAKTTTEGHDEQYLLLVVVTDGSKASSTAGVNELDLMEDLHRAGRISLQVHNRGTIQRESTSSRSS